jgi:hypothetical protein
MEGNMKKVLSLFVITGMLGIVLLGQGCALFHDQYAIEHKENNDNAWLEKKHGYRDIANYESEKFEEKYGRH